MGWKSTIELTREEAIRALLLATEPSKYNVMSNEQLENALYGLDFGDDINLPYYGHNFTIVNKGEDKI